MHNRRMLVFSGNAHPALARAICDYLDLPLGNASVKEFPDGELDVKIHDDVRGADTFVVQPTCHPVNKSLMELLLLMDCLKRASADRITASGTDARTARSSPACRSRPSWWRI